MEAGVRAAAPLGQPETFEHRAAALLAGRVAPHLVEPVPSADDPNFGRRDAVGTPSARDALAPGDATTLGGPRCAVDALAFSDHWRGAAVYAQKKGDPFTAQLAGRRSAPRALIFRCRFTLDHATSPVPEEAKGRLPGVEALDLSRVGVDAEPKRLADAHSAEPSRQRPGRTSLLATAIVPPRVLAAGFSGAAGLAQAQRRVRLA